MVEIIIGDLLEATEKYIVHQTNCVSQGGAAGLAFYLFKKFPYADVYANREKPDAPGTSIISGNGKDQRYVINLMGQYYPGSFIEDSTNDNEESRKTYFHHALIRLARISDMETVAFPYKIGCGIAGGNWKWYLGTINNFADFVKEKHGTKVVIYQREGDV